MLKIVLMGKHETEGLNLVLSVILNLTWNQIQQKSMSHVSGKKRKLYETKQSKHGFLLNNFMTML